jgi:hypothetical protein
MFIQQLKSLSAEQYWLTSRRVAAELGVSVNLKRPPTQTDVRWAQQERDQEIYWLERELNPPHIAARTKRRKIWNDLVLANTYSALRKACGRWARLPDVRTGGLTCFPEHVLTNAAQFLAMKQNKRFPGSGYADNARLEYFSRGMAGVLSGRSPMTGIERLRNMKHDSNGPLWVSRHENHVLPKNEQYCGCWRCRIESSNRVGAITRTGYENGLRLFVEISETTKVPKEWRHARSI